MKTLLKPAYYKILKLFYENRNNPLHLRDIARKVQLNESSVTRHLNLLKKEGVLISKSDANLKKFSIFYSYVPKIFEMFDEEKMANLPSIRRRTIEEYISYMEKKPVFLAIFGSTSKGTFKADSDLDVLEVFNEKTDTKKAKDYAEAQTGIDINSIQMTFSDFQDEIKLKKDFVIQSAITSCFTVFNGAFFYKVIFRE